MKLLTIVIIFLLIGGVLIYTSNDVSISDGDDRKTFAGAIWTWIKQLGGNSKDLAAHAVKQDWLPEK